jgi:hypothetical protein
MGHDVEDERDTADDAFARRRFGFEDGGECCCRLIRSLLVSLSLFLGEMRAAWSPATQCTRAGSETQSNN